MKTLLLLLLLLLRSDRRIRKEEVGNPSLPLPSFLPPPTPPLFLLMLSSLFLLDAGEPTWRRECVHRPYVGDAGAAGGGGGEREKRN